jgi:hypothetical protein
MNIHALFQGSWRPGDFLSGRHAIGSDQHLRDSPYVKALDEEQRKDPRLVEQAVLKEMGELARRTAQALEAYGGFIVQDWGSGRLYVASFAEARGAAAEGNTVYFLQPPERIGKVLERPAQMLGLAPAGRVMDLEAAARQLAASIDEEVREEGDLTLGEAAGTYLDHLRNIRRPRAVLKLREKIRDALKKQYTAAGNVSKKYTVDLYHALEAYLEVAGAGLGAQEEESYGELLEVLQDEDPYDVEDWDELAETLEGFAEALEELEAGIAYTPEGQAGVAMDQPAASYRENAPQLLAKSLTALRGNPGLVGLRTAYSTAVRRAHDQGYLDNGRLTPKGAKRLGAKGTAQRIARFNAAARTAKVEGWLHARALELGERARANPTGIPFSAPADLLSAQISERGVRQDPEPVIEYRPAIKVPDQPGYGSAAGRTIRPRIYLTEAAVAEYKGKRTDLHKKIRNKVLAELRTRGSQLEYAPDVSVIPTKRVKIAPTGEELRDTGAGTPLNPRGRAFRQRVRLPSRAEVPTTIPAGRLMAGWKYRLDKWSRKLPKSITSEQLAEWRGLLEQLGVRGWETLAARAAKDPVLATRIGLRAQLSQAGNPVFLRSAAHASRSGSAFGAAAKQILGLDAAEKIELAVDVQESLEGEEKARKRDERMAYLQPRVESRPGGLGIIKRATRSEDEPEEEEG